MSNSVKIYFRLSQDADGYPPVTIETLWTTPRPGEQFEIINIPFFIRTVTLGDWITAPVGPDEKRWFGSVVKKSENSLIRVVFFDRRVLDEVAASLKGMGCSTEYSADNNIMAINVPPTTKLAGVRAFLARGVRDGLIDCEEPLLRQ